MWDILMVSHCILISNVLPPLPWLEMRTSSGQKSPNLRWQKSPNLNLATSHHLRPFHCLYHTTLRLDPHFVPYLNLIRTLPTICNDHTRHSWEDLGVHHYSDNDKVRESLRIVWRKRSHRRFLGFSVFSREDWRLPQDFLKANQMPKISGLPS